MSYVAIGKVITPKTRAGLRGPCAERPVKVPFTAPEGAGEDEVEELARVALWRLPERKNVWFVAVSR